MFDWPDNAQTRSSFQPVHLGRLLVVLRSLLSHIMSSAGYAFTQRLRARRPQRRFPHQPRSNRGQSWLLKGKQEAVSSPSPKYVHRHRTLITPFSFARATSDLPRRYWPYHFPGHVQGHKSLHRCFLLLCSGSRLRCWRPTRAGTYRLYA